MAHYDAIVIGVGGMGSAAVYHLARRGLKVLGLEQYDTTHELGSSHGYSRMIRYTLQEHPSYVPLVRRAYELWHQLENASGERLVVTTGSVRAGPPDSPFFQNAKESCDIHHIPYEIMTGPETGKRFPGYRFPEGISSIYQSDGGFLLPERCIVSHVRAAQEAGAEVHGREAVLGWEPKGEGVEVRTGRDTHTARRLVVTAGAWAAKMVPQVARYAVPERQVLGWFQPERPGLFKPETFPVFGVLAEEGRYYGFPSYSVPGFKVGRSHHLRQQVDPDTMDREVHPEDEEILRQFVGRYFPLAAGPVLMLKTCMYTNTPDEHFIIGALPSIPQVSVAAGFSGHGFKFASVIGEIMADLAQHGETTHDISLFRLDRFGA
ncbi:MAG: N-methyl-L-tryptophan oxidase [Chloroflexi bacterium]|nr:N-methyl-L-tryptophan oxidase [Chloroflexota bacterium]MDA1270951.1 N-methyl-L-tryptophan oxidase [Chloroflexota bacterium]PKB59020.1 MAG: N-methyltryptophan oxidase [SAR202 cluster bacterium Casp-Chloro-G2]